MRGGEGETRVGGGLAQLLTLSYFIFAQSGIPSLWYMPKLDVYVIVY